MPAATNDLPSTALPEEQVEESIGYNPMKPSGQSCVSYPRTMTKTRIRSLLAPPVQRGTTVTRAFPVPFLDLTVFTYHHIAKNNFQEFLEWLEQDAAHTGHARWPNRHLSLTCAVTHCTTPVICGAPLICHSRSHLCLARASPYRGEGRRGRPDDSAHPRCDVAPLFSSRNV